MLLKRTLKAKALKGTFSKLISQLSTTSVKFMGMLLPTVQVQSKSLSIKKLPVTNSESNSGEIISQAEEPAGYDSDKEIKSEKNEESNTLILPKNTPVIT